MTPPSARQVQPHPPERPTPTAAQPGAAITHAAPGPQTTAGAVVPDHAAPAVTQGGWGAALTELYAHYVPAGAAQGIHFGRPTGVALDGWDALIDRQGLEDGEQLPKCGPCTRQLALMSASRQVQQ